MTEERTGASEGQRTPLYDAHLALGGRIVDFHGWLMPVQYRSILEEHRAVRQTAGLFDVSHMGEVEVKGPSAGRFLEGLLTQNVQDLTPGRARYALMLDAQAGVVDDLVVYARASDDFLLIVNASRAPEDLAWITDKANSVAGVSVKDVGPTLALLALQGPRAAEILDRLTQGQASSIRRFRFAQLRVGGVDAVVSRTGYTGEDGFELMCQAEAARQLWDVLLREGRPDGLLPCGLGARDTLRLEAALPLHGQEIGPDLSPLAAGLDRFVKLDKADFIGRGALLNEQAAGVPRRVVGLAFEGHVGVPRTGQSVVDERGQEIGKVTSGAISPTLGHPIALAVVPANYAAPGVFVGVMIRGKMAAAEVVPLPFYKRGA